MAVVNRSREIPPLRYVALGVFTVAASLFIIAPLAVVVLNSFNNVAYNVFPPEELSTRWYVNLFSQDVFYAAAGRSIVLAALSTGIALVIGIMAAYALVRYKLPAPDLIKASLLSPIVLPKIVLGVALFMFFVRIRMLDNYSSLLVTHVLVILPFVIAMVSASLANFDWTLQEAAMDLGAGPIRTFIRVILPQISLSVGISAVFAFITSFDQVETTIFMVRTGSNTLPVEMFLYLQKWQDPTIAALSTLLILFAIALVMLISLMLRGRRLPFLPQRPGEDTQ
ncbi:MAG: ABC transporter permease [Rhizobiales bacterium]|nr:ABC transporter permease [Hyphomicrobiales bacterium]